MGLTNQLGLEKKKEYAFLSVMSLLRVEPVNIVSAKPSVPMNAVWEWPYSYMVGSGVQTRLERIRGKFRGLSPKLGSGLLPEEDILSSSASA